MEKYYYHVISDIPKKVGEHIILGDKHPNGVHKRVYEELETVKDINANTEYKYFELREKPDLKDMAADWFHKKWGVPKDAYLECMTAYLNKETENGW